MICPKCNTVNEDYRFQCRKCKHFLNKAGAPVKRIKLEGPSTPRKLGMADKPRAFQAGLPAIKEPESTSQATLEAFIKKSFREAGLNKDDAPIASPSPEKEPGQPLQFRNPKPESVPVIEEGIEFEKPATDPIPLDQSPLVEPVGGAVDDQAVTAAGNSARMTSSPIAGKSAKSRSLIPFLVAGIVLIALVIAGFAYSNYQTQKNNAAALALFNKAESRVGSQDFAAALILYQQYMDDYPGHSHSILAMNRIKRLKDKLLAERAVESQQQQYLDSLLGYARAAYDTQRLFEPEEDNALFYLNQVFALDSTNSPALELRSDMLAQIEAQAGAAFENRDYKVAKAEYRNMLVVDPDNTYAHEQLENIKGIIIQAGLKRNRQPGRQGGASTYTASSQGSAEEQQRAILEQRIDELRQKRRSYLEDINNDQLPVTTTDTDNDQELFVETSPLYASSENKLDELYSEMDIQNLLNNESRNLAEEHDLSQLLNVNPETLWKPIKRNLRNEVIIIRENSKNLVLYHQSVQDSLIVSVRPSAIADMYASAEQRRGANPYRVWVATERLWNDPVRLAHAWETFFRESFQKEIRPPRN